MPSFNFTSLHRPVGGSSFLDFSTCQTDDALYDEARGPVCMVYRCVEDYEVLEDDVAQDLQSDVSYHRQVDQIEIERWIESRYRDYMHNEPEEEPCSSGMQYGHDRVRLWTTTSRDSQKNSCDLDPKRNRGRKLREWWSTLAIERREKKREGVGI